MRIIRTFECTRDHTFDDFADNAIPLGDDFRMCPECLQLMTEHGRLHPGVCSAWYPRANAVLSPTATTFKFADTSAQKHARG